MSIELRRSESQKRIDDDVRALLSMADQLAAQGGVKNNHLAMFETWQRASLAHWARLGQLTESVIAMDNSEFLKPSRVDLVIGRTLERMAERCAGVAP